MPSTHLLPQVQRRLQALLQHPEQQLGALLVQGRAGGGRRGALVAKAQRLQRLRPLLAARQHRLSRLVLPQLRPCLPRLHSPAGHRHCIRGCCAAVCVCAPTSDGALPCMHRSSAPIPHRCTCLEVEADKVQLVVQWHAARWQRPGQVAGRLAQRRQRSASPGGAWRDIAAGAACQVDAGVLHSQGRRVRHGGELRALDAAVKLGDAPTACRRPPTGAYGAQGRRAGLC